MVLAKRDENRGKRDGFEIATKAVLTLCFTSHLCTIICELTRFQISTKWIWIIILLWRHNCKIRSRRRLNLEWICGGMLARKTQQFVDSISSNADVIKCSEPRRAPIKAATSFRCDAKQRQLRLEQLHLPRETSNTKATRNLINWVFEATSNKGNVTWLVLQISDRSPVTGFLLPPHKAAGEGRGGGVVKRGRLRVTK